MRSLRRPPARWTAAAVVAVSWPLLLSACKGGGSEETTVADSEGIGTLGMETADGTMSGSGSETAMDHGPVLYLLVEPAEAVIEVDLGMTASQAYTVTAVYADGM